MDYSRETVRKRRVRRKKASRKMPFAWLEKNHSKINK